MFKTVSHRRMLLQMQFLILVAFCAIMESRSQAAELLIGGATVSITPDQPVALWGQMHTRISTAVESPVTATVLALESVDGGKPIEQAVMVACPSQEVEGGSAINADFWHQVRETLRASHGKDLHVLAWTGAGGDQSPHLMFRKQAEERMRNLRGISRLDEISRRIVSAWNEAYDGAQKDQHSDVPLIHTVQEIELPRREVLEREWLLARSTIDDLSRQQGKQTLLYWHGGVVKRYEQQLAGTAEPFKMEPHVIRLGDIAIATNPFELFTDYGIRMKTQSPALQTFVIQLAGPGSYLPSARAVQGGGYSAIAESNEVGPEGGQVLVERTLEQINALWPVTK